MVRSTLTLLALFNVAILFPGKAMSQNSEGREFNGKYQKEYLDKIAFPIGGIGAGMFCLEGTGAISHVSLRHHPDVMNEPYTFAAIYVKGVENGAKVLEGQVPTWKLFGPAQSGLGRGDKTYGLPRFEEAVFQARFLCNCRFERQGYAFGCKDYGLESFHSDGCGQFQFAGWSTGISIYKYFR